MDVDQGDTTLLGNLAFDEVGVRFDLSRKTLTAARLGNGLTKLLSDVPPANHSRHADTEMRCSRPATHASIIRSDNPIPKVL